MTDPDRFATEVLAVNDFTGYDPATGCFDPDLVERSSGGREFTFWYPTGEYLDFDLVSRRAVKDCPTGRCEPGRTDGRDRFSVLFRMEWGPTPGVESSDSRQYRKLQDWAERSRSGQPQPGENIPTWEDSWKGPITQTKDYRIFDDDGTVVTLVRCFLLTEIRGHNRDGYCRGDFYDRESGALVFVVFHNGVGLHDGDEHWRGVVDMIRAKIAEWRVD
ncbi:MAG: hypothetical protein AAF366_22425 [Pseudomonadota bacterium]